MSIRSQLLISLFILLIAQACKEDNVDNVEKEWPIEHEFDLVSTEMIPESPIALPDGVVYECVLINSLEDLGRQIPSELISSSGYYEKIDFSENSLISIRFRTFYTPKKIDYRVFVNNYQDLLIGQRIYVEGQLTTSGYYVMSNFIISHIESDTKISLSQSYEF